MELFYPAIVFSYCISLWWEKSKRAFNEASYQWIWKWLSFHIYFSQISCQISFTNNFPSFNIQNKNGTKKTTFAKSDFWRRRKGIQIIFALVSLIRTIGNQSASHELSLLSTSSLPNLTFLLYLSFVIHITAVNIQMQKRQQGILLDFYQLLQFSSIMYNVNVFDPSYPPAHFYLHLCCMLRNIWHAGVFYGKWKP